MMSRPPVLVLDGHTIQALACVRSLGRSGHPVFVASRYRSPLAAWSRYCRGRFRLRGETVGAFAELRGWAAARGVRVVLPLTERACILCNAERCEWNAAGVIVGCGPNEMLLQAFDKARTLKLARACGIGIPPTRFPTTPDGYRDAADELGLPCVIKARFSHAWQGTRFLVDPGIAYVTRPDELAPAVTARRQGAHAPIIQSFIRGKAKGVFALCDHGRPVAWFAHERLRDIRPSGSGSSLRRSVALTPPLRAAAERLLTSLAWHGPAMLEFFDDGDGVPRLIEMNGRFWGSLQLAITAGVDFPAQWIRLLLGEPVPPSDSYRRGVTLRYLWGDVKRFLYIVSGPPTGYPAPYPRPRQGLAELLGPQPTGTRLETWDRGDPSPALGEWLQGLVELLERARNHKRPPDRVEAG